MRIALYFIHWQDSIYLPLIREHYGKFCERIVMLDNHSEDDSADLGRVLGFDVQTFGYKAGLNDQSYMDVKNNVWKECRGQGFDYVIVCDCDEFLCLPEGVRLHATAPIVNGFDMISDSLPNQTIFSINTGEPSVNYSKQVIFDPDAITEIAYVHGAHVNNMVGEITTHGPQCRLLHYRRIGGVERMIKRHAQYRPRLSKFNLKHQMGHHYGRPEWNDQQLIEFNEAKRKEWAIGQANAQVLW